MMQSALKVLVACLLLLIGVWLGLFISKNQLNHSNFSSNSKFDEILSTIHYYYVDSVDESDLLDKSIHHLLTNLDPHSLYIPKKDLESINEPLVGNFEGIGVEFHLLKDTILIVSPIVGGPSEMMGIQSGDKIITINDTNVAGIGIQNDGVFKLLRGKGGTKVKLGIKRNGTKDLINFFIVRDKIPLYSVDIAYMVQSQVGYIKINSFGANTHEEFVNKLNELKEAGMTKLIIDLRQNGGGYLDAAVAIADELIESNQLLTYTEGRHFKRQSYYAEHRGVFETGELVVLIDEGSASASEILSGAVQDLDRGKVIGRRSFGKGLVMSDFMLSDSSSLRLSMARYYTPSGRCVQKSYKEGYLDYEFEVYNRFKIGGMYKDTLDGKNLDTTKYYTKKGRLVKGGGGIFPDVFVSIDTSYNMKMMAEIRNQIPEFVYQIYPEIKNEIDRFESIDQFVKQYKPSPNIYNRFIEVCKNEKIAMKPNDMIKLDQKIKLTMMAYIARNKWKNEGFYRILNSMDPTFNKAISEMK